MRQTIRLALPAALMLYLGGCSLVGGSGPGRSPLLDPSSAAINLVAPDTFKVLFETTNGDFVVEVYREWAPRGADRFFSLVYNRYYDDIYFFRNISGFMTQFGIHGEPAVSEAWKEARIADDSVSATNERGTISFAMAGPDTRTVQLFINHGNNARLDALGFAPFGRVTGGMDTIDRLYSGYGESAPQGRGPSQDLISSEGNSYLRESFPLLDSIRRARLVPGDPVNED